MNWARIAAIMLRQWYLLRGSPARIVPIFAWVAIDIVLWGFITRYLNTIAAATSDFVPKVLGAVLLWDFFVRIMFGVTTAFFEDIWSRNFLNIFGSPLSNIEYLTGLVLTSIGTSFFALLAMMLLAVCIFGFSLFSYGAMMLPFVLVLFLFGIALGIVAVAVVLRLGPASEWLIWPIPMLLSPFAGVFYPLSILPQWMRAVSRVLPPAYVFESLRAIVNDGSFDLAPLVFAALLAGLYIILACAIFMRVFRHALRSGLIARYSAETVT